MKKLAFAGQRLFLKFTDLSYFNRRAEEIDGVVVPVREEDDKPFAEKVRDASVLVVIARTITSEIIEGLEKCKLIQTLSVGYDCVDVPAATKRGIPVCNTPAYCTDEVANHAMTLILATARKLGMILPKTRGADWEYKYTKPILNFRDKKLGIIGLGRIGRTIVPKAKGFGMRVAAYDPYLHDDIFAGFGVERINDIDELFETADYITIHALLTGETRHLVDDRAFQKMKETAIIVNTARGDIIDEEALCRALADGRIAGAGIDVLTKEPPAPENPLLSMDNVIVTPHISWYSEESFKRDMEDGMDEIIRVLSGKRPRYIINPEIFYAR